MTTAALTHTAFGTELLRHLDAQLDSARRLLEAVLRQGGAIRGRAVDQVLSHLATIQGEMDRRAVLERDRTRLLQQAGVALGVPAHAVTLEALTVLLGATQGEAARARSAELRGLLGEIGREHHVNRALMRQELAFLSHLVGMLGGADTDGGYRPPTQDGAPMRVTHDAPLRHRALDLEA